MAADYGALRIVVTADTKGLGKDIASAAKKAGDDGGKQMSSGLDKALKSTSKTAVGTIGKIGSAIGGGLKSAFNGVSNVAAVGMGAVAGLGLSALKTGTAY